MSKKIILHLCADLGSDSKYYQLDPDYEVICIGESIGVENYHPPKKRSWYYCQSCMYRI